MVHILAIDPGITTGCATYQSSNKEYQTFVIPKTFEAVYTLVYRPVDIWDLVIVEGFSTPGLIAKYGLDTVELIGAIKALCHVKDIKCVVQYPVERRGSIEFAKIMLRNSGRKHWPPHEEDALSHIIAYQRKQKEFDFDLVR